MRLNDADVVAISNVRRACYCWLMGAEVALEGLLESLSRCLDAESARRLIAMQVAEPIQERIDQLAQQANDGALSDSGRSEYEALINAADLISILKLKARDQLQAEPL